MQVGCSRRRLVPATESRRAQRRKRKKKLCASVANPPWSEALPSSQFLQESLRILFEALQAVPAEEEVDATLVDQEYLGLSLQVWTHWAGTPDLHSKTLGVGLEGLLVAGTGKPVAESFMI